MPEERDVSVGVLAEGGPALRDQRIVRVGVGDLETDPTQHEALEVVPGDRDRERQHSARRLLRADARNQLRLMVAQLVQHGMEALEPGVLEPNDAVRERS